jgi:hypothetical protein
LEFLSSIASLHKPQRMGAVDVSNGHAVAPKKQQAVLKKNNSSGPWIVQKFGGTSVGKFAVNIAEDIVG